jgi:hypothetical protein
VIAEFLIRRHARLRRQLQIAYGLDPWPSDRIDRIADRLAATERALVQARVEPRVRENGSAASA